MPKVQKSITVEAPVDVVYRAWRNFENLPQFMDNIEEVRVTAAGRSHWKAKGPLGTAPEWDAEITLDEPERTIGWRSIEGSSTKTSGRVDFSGRSARTDIEVTMEYEAPGGVLGEVIAKIFSDPERQVDEDLHRFKKIMEHNVEASALNLFSASDENNAPLGSSMGATTVGGLEAIADANNGMRPSDVDDLAAR